MKSAKQPCGDETEQKNAQSERDRVISGTQIEITDMKGPKLDSGDRGDDWHNWIVAYLLLEEAKGVSNISPIIPAQPESPVAPKAKR